MDRIPAAVKSLVVVRLLLDEIASVYALYVLSPEIGPAVHQKAQAGRVYAVYVLTEAW